jgi:periplasmic protein TonB
MAASPEIFFEQAHWRKPVFASVALHAGLAGVLVVYALYFQGSRGPMWGTGGGGDAMSATLVSSLPLPSNETQSQSVLATESKGLSQSQPVAQTQEPDAIAIPDKDTKKKITKPVNSTVKPREPEPQPSNRVPFGEGGPAATFSASGGQGGMSFSGGSGDFGSKYAYYVTIVQQKVSQNWLKYEVDPAVRDGRRVYVSFDISRGGEPSSIQVEQSSGVPTLDVSAVRALKRIDTFGPLPSDYAGNKVSVEFWFDWKK